MKTKHSLLMIFLFLSTVLLGGCSTLAYKFKAPKRPDVAQKRLCDIDWELKKISGHKDSAKLRSKYYMEMGLIWEKVEKQDQDAIHYYQKAVSEDPGNCDARICLAAVLSRKTRSDESISEARRMVSSMGDCPEGTIVVFNRAKMDIISKDSQNLNNARNCLEELSTLNLGNSGVTQNEIINLLLFAYLKEGNFPAADERMKETPAVKLIPRLEALMLIGNLEMEKLRQLQSQPSVVEFLLKGNPSDYFPLTKIERLILASNEEVGTTMPDESDSGDITSIERKLQRINLREDKRLLDFQLEKRQKKIAVIKTNLKQLKHAKIYLLRSELKHYLSGTLKADHAYQQYIAADQNLRKSILELSEILQDIMAVGNPEELVDKPEVILEDANLLDAFMEKQVRSQSEMTIVQDLFQSFAVRKSASIRFSDFFVPFTVRLDDLSYSSRDVKESIQKLIALTGQGR